MHTDTYVSALVIASGIIALLTSYFTANAMATCWGMSTDERYYMRISAAATAGVASLFICTSAIQFAGLPGGLVWVALAMPFTGFVWIFMVGGNKVIEKIMNGLLSKVS